MNKDKINGNMSNEVNVVEENFESTTEKTSKVADDNELIELEEKNSKESLVQNSMSTCNNEEISQKGERKSPQKEFIGKLANQVEVYINQCYEMDEIPKRNENIDVVDDSTMNNKDDNNNRKYEEPVAILDVKEQSHKKIESQPQTINKVMTVPTIHITNEYGQDRSINIDTNNYHREQQDQPQQQPRPKVAVVMNNVSFSYSKSNKVLFNINLAVPKAQIFALLGASGSGKTTLLKIILGRIVPKKGDVLVFGAQPGSVHSNIPGSGVGFMPQELALFPMFSIKETLYYFGLLHHISKAEIDKRIDFMIELLNLPPKNRRIEQCSGGQQRRVSIALTLFHSPPLLILDEPTVGVDPLLRLKIWQYLEYLCVNNRMTIIITTHYIEESRRANNLAFMRFGRILSQDSPENLLTKYNTTVLEDVFLKLCQQDCGDIKQKHSIKRKDIQQEQQRDIYEPKIEPIRSKYHNFTLDFIRMKALFFKNFVEFKRNPLVFFFPLLLPVIQIILFCTSVYKSPENIVISIYNADTKGLSKRFLGFIDKELLSVKNYNSLDEAVQTVVDGKAWAAIEMGKNFSDAYRRRAKNPSDLNEQDFNNSKIKLYTDHTDNFMHAVFENSLMYSYQLFVENIAESFGYNPSSVQIPISVKESVYSELDLRRGYVLIDNLVSGSLIAIIYSIPLLMTGMIIVTERKNKIIERTFVNGATSLEIFLSHLLTLMLLLMLQEILLLFVTLYMFQVTMLGSLTEVFILVYMQGLTGILIGLFISTVSKNEIIAFILSLGVIFPVWMMSGVFWPLESIDPWLQKIFWTIPLTYPIRSTSHIFKRGWSYEYYEVMMGYISSSLYNTILLAINIFTFHLNSH